MKLRDNKGSVTVFVLVGLTFMSSFLLISYANNVNKSKIAKEQYSMIGNTYSYYDGNANAYNRAYDALRLKNRTTDVEYKENKTVIDKIKNNDSKDISKNDMYITFELKNTFAEKLINYKIYGTVPDQRDSNDKLYKIYIKLKNDSKENEYCIKFTEPLRTVGDVADYIDYANQRIVRKVRINYNTGAFEEMEEKYEPINLPDIALYEDYTEISVQGAKVELEYACYNNF